MKKKALSVLAIVICFTFLLPACSNKEKDNQESIQTATTSTTEQNVEKDPLGKYDPPIEITTVRDIPNPAVVKYPPGDDINNNAWTRAYERDLGIKVKYLWTVDASQFREKMNIMLISGDLPDFFYVTTRKELQDLVESNLVLETKDIFEDWALPEVKLAYDSLGQNLYNQATFNGSIYAIPYLSMSREAVPILWVRADWLSKLNLPEPKTMDEFINVATAFAKNDPDKNNKNDTYGFAIDNGSGLGFGTWQQGFYNGYHAYPGAWIKDDSGNLVLGTVQPEMKNAIIQLNKFYKDGVIDPEFITKDFLKIYEPLGAGKIGMAFGPYYIGIAPLQNVIDANPDADFVNLPIPSVDNKPAAPFTASDVSAYWVINKNCKHPEAVVKLLNYYMKIFYFNNDKKVYEEMVNGPEYTAIYMNAAIMSLLQYANINWASKAMDVLEGRIDADSVDPVSFDYYTKIKAYKDGDIKMWGWFRGLTSAMDVLNYYKKNNLYVFDEFYGTPTKTMEQKGADLNNILIDGIYKLIYQSTNPSEDFDKLVKQWEENGGKDLTKEINDWYKSAKK